MSDPNERLPKPVKNDAGEAGISLHDAGRELMRRADPEQVAPPEGLELPWSARARARSEARDAALAANLDVFKDDLRAIRIAHEVLSRAVTLRAVEAAETAMFEIRARGETFRLAALNRAQIEMTREFVAQLERLEVFREQLPPEILDALKERALAEFTTRMNAASGGALAFPKEWLLRLREAGP